jgi:phosphatidate cytidylyltransferase
MNKNKIIIGLLLSLFSILTLQYKKVKLVLSILFSLGIGEIIFNYIKYKFGNALLLSFASIVMILSNIFFINFNIISVNTLFIFFIKTILNDTIQEIFGKIFGRIKVTNISPNKTLEGYLGGYLVTLLLSNNSNLIGNTMIYILNIFGDLYFSYIKRKYGIKDYSQLLLSHGGVLDRLDSVIILLFVYGIYKFIFK